jgi:hypothetical protein
MLQDFSVLFVQNTVGFRAATTDMKRWRLPMILFFLVIVGVLSARHVQEKRTQQRREAHYHAE